MKKGSTRRLMVLMLHWAKKHRASKYKWGMAQMLWLFQTNVDHRANPSCDSIENYINNLQKSQLFVALTVDSQSFTESVEYFFISI